jgi:MraZ protein
MDASAACTSLRRNAEGEIVQGVGGTTVTFKPLIGTDEATIDDKGRILIGKKKRDRLGEPFTIALGDVGCLVAYPEFVWQRMLGEILSHESINQGRQQYTRLVLGTADDELKFDMQGRVVVPQKLRDLAGIQDKVVLVGCGDRLEIWAKQEWEQYNANPETYGQERKEAIAKAYSQMVGK